LRISQVLVPASPGALSASGVLAAYVIKDQSRTVMLEVGRHINAALEDTFTIMEKEARATLRREGFPTARQRHERLLAVRYKGQSFELEIKYSKNIAVSFHRAHNSRYGYAQMDNVIEIVSARLRSVGMVAKIRERRQRVTRKKLVDPEHYSKAYFGDKEMRAAVYRRENLVAGMRLRTPCIVTEYSATTLVPSTPAVEVDSYLNLVIQLKQ